MKKIILLGATGSVGASVLSVIRHYPENFTLVGFSGWSNINQTVHIIKEFSPKYVVLKHAHDDLPLLFPHVTFFYGNEGLQHLVQQEGVDTVVSSILGFSGFLPALETLKSGKNLVIANKEALVVGGNFLKEAAKKSKVQIIPLDSEHLSLFDLMRGKNPDEIQELIITASGGPFLYETIDASISTESVLNHPTWKMGPHISVSSALMINKGLEVIEAMRLFDVPESKIRVLIHPQSLVHAALKTKGGHWHFLASPTDMRYPAQYALFFPEIPTSAPFGEYEPTLSPLEFLDPDYDKFRLLALARHVARADGLLPTVLCAATEVAINQFLAGNIKFYKISDVVQEIVEKFPNKNKPEIDDIIAADKKTKITMLERITFNGDELR